jgi:TrmH family RNA methyltransferase
MDIKLTRYKKDLDHSYSLGVYPTLELLTYQPEICLGVLLHAKGEKNQGVAKIRALCVEEDIPVQEDNRLVERIAQKGNTYAIGIFRKTRLELDRNRNHVVLVNPMGMGNLGTIMRAMLGFGHQDLVIIEPAADLFDPRVVRASMGGLFQIRAASYEQFSDYWGSYPNHQLYPLMTDGAQALPEISLEPPYALIFGNESSGLPDEFHQYGSSLRIPQAGAIDSLNLALSVGITLYQAWIAAP